MEWKTQVELAEEDCGGRQSAWDWEGVEARQLRLCMIEIED